MMQILRTIAADPAVSTADVSLLTDADRAVLAQLPAPIIDTAHTGSSLVDLFTEAAAAHPDSVAVSCGSESFTLCAARRAHRCRCHKSAGARCRRR